LENKYEAVGWVWWYVAIIPATQVEVGLSWFEASLGRVSLRPYLENKVKAKRASGMAQVTECLPVLGKTKSETVLRESVLVGVGVAGVHADG
jgi:hypothetical protein